MRIKRVQIEEGFLDGFDESFVPGLNVIVGERGTGKTSLIELVRFCLGVYGYTADSGKRSTDHALSILGTGQVTVTLTNGEQDILVTRTASDESPRLSGSFVPPIILSQTEIESVGLQAQGRIRLLDSFLEDQKRTRTRESEACSEIRSLTAEADAQRREIDKLTGLMEELPALDKRIAELLPQERKVEEASAEANRKKRQLDAISAQIAESAVGCDAIERFRRSIVTWQSALIALASAQPILESWPEGAGPDPLAKGRSSVERAKNRLTNAVEDLEEAVGEAQLGLQLTHDKKINVEDEARRLRKEVDALQEGAGTIVRQGQQLREHKAQLESLREVLAGLRNRLNALLAARNAALDRLDSIREGRFDARSAVARALNETLGPRIHVKVARAGEFDTFAAAVADALRGSGLRYNELSSTLARRVSPRELLEAVDRHDSSLIAEAAGITEDRAARALNHLRDCDIGGLTTTTVEDAVAFKLLDGADYKGIAELSTGQRCTVVLPLVLRHTERVVVVDQPEDHIDNAFIAETLIVSVLARNDHSQIIFSTHNANIPVLGNADRVIQLGSDGRRGFRLLASGLQDPSVVNAITTVMEGGAEAFRRRATFYGRHGTP